MNESFDFNKLFRESIECLMKPKEYFSAMKITGGFTEPVIRALMYGVIAGGIYLFWYLLNLNVAGGLLFGAVSGIMIFFSSVMISVIGLFVGGAILLLISAICRGNADLEANIRVLASSMVIWPVIAALGFLYGIIASLAAVAGTAAGLYGIYLLYNGLIYSLKADERNSRISAYILAGLSILSLFRKLF
jgi:hypothetical protein